MKNWKTFAAGLGLGFLNLLANGVTPKQAAVSIGMTALGAMAKDFDKSNAPNPTKDAQSTKE